MSSSGATRGGIAVAFGTAAARPAAAGSNANTGWFATDTAELTVSDGAAWHSIGKTSVNFVAGPGPTITIGNSGGSSALFDSLTAWADNGGVHNWVTSNGIDITAAGKGLLVAEGANAKQGTIAAMTAGSIAVANTSVTANSRIFVCRSAGGTNPGAWYVSSQTAGTGFTASSTNAADTGTGIFQIFEPG